MTLIPKEVLCWILSLFDILQRIVDMLWLDAPRTLLLKTALGKAKRHPMHNPKLTILKLNVDEMETLQHNL